MKCLEQVRQLSRRINTVTQINESSDGVINSTGVRTIIRLASGQLLDSTRQSTRLDKTGQDSTITRVDKTRQLLESTVMKR